MDKGFAYADTVKAGGEDGGKDFPAGIAAVYGDVSGKTGQMS